MRPVESVWIWRYNDPWKAEAGNFSPSSTEKAVHGRFPGSTYTKDYLQFPNNSPELEEAFPIGNGRVDVTYHWIGGRKSCEGSIEKSSDRPHLKWPTGNVPECFQASSSPSAEGPYVIEGERSASSGEAADSEIEQINRAAFESNRTYFLLAIKLAGEENELHLRTYIDNPSPDLACLDTQKLPKVIRESIERLKPRRDRASVCVRFNASDDPLLKKALGMLSKNPNLLLVGPPGTGKSVLLKRIQQYVEDGVVLFDPESQSHWEEHVGGGLARSLVFHPSYAYENFVVGLYPHAASNGVSVKPIAGPLAQLASYSNQTGKRSLLVIDEINRGNAAAIFGEALALLDADKRGTESVALPYKNIENPVEEEYWPSTSDSYLTKGELVLPEQLWIVAAMNSSDRSAVPLDAALRRRFSTLFIPPNYQVLKKHLKRSILLGQSSVEPANDAMPIAEAAVSILERLNARIACVSGSDFELGQSLMWDVSCEGGMAKALESLVSAWDSRVAPLLRLNYRDDDLALSKILGASAEGVIYSWIEVPDDLANFGTKRLSLLPISELDEDGQKNAVSCLAGRPL